VNLLDISDVENCLAPKNGKVCGFEGLSKESVMHYSAFEIAV